MARITEALLRQRAEHNEKMLANLEEIALHQQDIERIENLDKLCRHIQILLLQNNIIDKIENVSKLKELQYLNLAVNNIKTIENLEGCESLRKLDLTCNFVGMEDLEESLYNLKKCGAIEELYLTGNPCQDFAGWRELTIAIVDQLRQIEGKEVVPSEKILAKQKLPELLIDLKTAIEMKRIKDTNEPANENAYTRESRKEMYLEIAQQKEEEEKRKHPENYVEKKVSSTHYPNGEARQCNEGKYDFKLEQYDDPEFVHFEMKIPRFLDTSLLDVNLQPKLISVRIKDKLTQLKLSDEIYVEKSEIKRSQITGNLVIKMPKVERNEVLVRMKKQEEQKLEQEQKKEEEQKKRLRKERELAAEEAHQATIEQRKKEKNKAKAQQNNDAQVDETKQNTEIEVDYDLDDIPDLE